MQSIDILRSYDIPDTIIEIWKKRGIKNLMPFQLSAIKKHRLLDDEDLLVSAPTTSGKTLLGEFTTIRAALKRKKSLYLVPLKALAEEKFDSFRSLGKESGLRVVVSSRDRHDFDKDLSTGNFDIAVIVYEKFLYYLQSEVKFLHQFGLIVMDELQLISDPERGSLLELILSRFKQLPSGPQFLGLSAVLPLDSQFTSWLNVPVLHEMNRPIELRMGYLEGSDFHYWSGDHCSKTVEEGFCYEGADKQETLIGTVSLRTLTKEQCIVFAPDRRSTRYQALLAAEEVKGAPDLESIHALEAMEDTVSRDELITVMQKGVAFHNADLLPEEREIVEDAFREGRIQAIFATTTLAMGVNLPAKNVFLQMEKWLSLPGEDKPFLAPIRKSEFVNMGGRAGRRHLNDDFGRAIMLTDNLIEREQFRLGIVEEDIDDFTPWMMYTDPDTIILSILGINAAETDVEIIRFLASSFSAYAASAKGTETDFTTLVNKSIENLLDWKLLSKTDKNTLELTRAGEITVRFGLKARTGGYLCTLLDEILDERIDLLSAAFMMLSTEEGKTASATLSSGEMSAHGSYYFREVEDALSHVTVEWIQKESGISENPWDWVKICKSALLIRDFVGRHGNREIEQRYNTYYGGIIRLGEQVSWLLEACASMIPKKRDDDNLYHRLTKLSVQVRYGIPHQVVFLAQKGIQGLGRERLHALYRFGVSSWETLAEIERDDLEKMTTMNIANRLTKIVREEMTHLSGMSNSRKITSLKLIGKQIGRRSTAEVNGELVHIRDRDFEVLLRLAIAKLEDRDGWVDRYSLGLADGSITQGISRVRNTLRDPSTDPDGWIEADGNGHYRLKLDSSQIELDHNELSRHWSPSVKQLVAEVA